MTKTEDLQPCPFCEAELIQHPETKVDLAHAFHPDTLCFLSGEFVPANMYMLWNCRAPTSQWRSMDTAPRDGSYFLASKDTWSFERTVFFGHGFFRDAANKSVVKDFLWQPITPPTKDLADAGKEKV